MKPCRQCDNDDWKFEKVDGWINATCKQCGNTFSFELKEKKKVEEGGDCRRCGAKVELRPSRMTEAKKKKPYYFTHLLVCTNRKCHTPYLSEKYKVLNHEMMERNIQESVELGKQQL